MTTKNLFALFALATTIVTPALHAAPASKAKAKSKPNAKVVRVARPVKAAPAPPRAPLTPEQQRKLLAARRARAEALYIANQRFLAVVALAGLSAEQLSAPNKPQNAPKKAGQPNAIVNQPPAPTSVAEAEAQSPTLMR